jgi:glycosyltransferase involved in cell wall biosynthesis
VRNFATKLKSMARNADDATMRLAVVEPTPYGGLLHYAVQLADALAERGNDVDLITTRGNELAHRDGPARRLAVLAPGGPAPTGTPSKLEETVRRARTALRLAASWSKIAKDVRFGGYDAVIVNGSFDLVLTAAGALAVNAVKGRTVVSHVCHNIRPINRWGGDNMFLESGTTISMLRRAYPSFDLLFVHGERSLAEYRETWPPTRMAVIPHGDERIFSDEPPPPTQEPRILFFGAWRKMKGLPLLMEAFDRLSERRPDAKLTIAGPPVPEEGEAERVLAWAADRGDRVEVRPDYVPVDDVPGLFRRARVVVLPYLAGYQSGVVHLAMTMQRAVVAADVGDLGAAVDDGSTGLVVPRGDVGALVGALDRVVGDPQLADRFGAAGRARVMNGSGWPTVAARVQEALESVVNDR